MFLARLLSRFKATVLEYICYYDSIYICTIYVMWHKVDFHLVPHEETKTRCKIVCYISRARNS